MPPQVRHECICTTRGMGQLDPWDTGVDSELGSYSSKQGCKMLELTLLFLSLGMVISLHRTCAASSDILNTPIIPIICHKLREGTGRSL